MPARKAGRPWRRPGSSCGRVESPRPTRSSCSILEQACCTGGTSHLPLTREPKLWTFKYLAFSIRGDSVRKTMRVMGLILVAAAALPLAARAQESQCPLLKYHSNFRLNGAMQHLTVAEASTFPDVKRGRLN